MLERATKRPAKSPKRHIAVEPEKARTSRRIAAAVPPILERPPDEDLAPDAADFGEGELESDGEEQQHDPHLGQHLDVVLGLDDADARRPGDGASDDERDDRRDADAAENEDEDQGDRVGQYQFGQGRVRGHGSV